LKENKLFLRLEKCKFYKQRIEYLGLVISENEVFMDLVKVAGVREWPTPENKMDIQAFLGFVSQTSFGHISINSPSILTVLLSTESP